MLTAANLQAGCGASASLSASWLPTIQAACDQYQINTPKRLAAFLATIGVESEYLTAVQENLNYSAQGLAACWPRLFAGPNDLANSIAHNQEAIANHAYANLNGNGDADSGNGWTYRGRGLIEITGLNNYARCAALMGIDVVNNPDLLLKPTYAALSAAWFWSDNKLNALADSGSFTAISKVVNCGNPNSSRTPNGMPERLKLYSAACASLGL